MAIENAWRAFLLACQMLFYNRALKTQNTNLMETCVDFMVKENCGCRGCSSSSQEFSLDQLSISEIVTRVSPSHEKVCVICTLVPGCLMLMLG